MPPNSHPYDSIIIGAGHNGLVCANYLAKAGQRVLMLERRAAVGGAAASEQVFPGYTFSRFSYVFSIFRPVIIKELFPENWKQHLTLYPNDPSLFVPSEQEDDFLLLTQDAEQTHASMTQFASAHDAKAYPLFLEKLDQYAQLLDPLLDTEPAGSYVDAIKLLPKVGLPRWERATGLIQFIQDSSANILNQHFDSDRLKAALAFSSTVGQCQSPYHIGSALLQLHHVAYTLQEGAHKFRYYPKGGMGAVSAYLASLAQQRGVEIRTQTPVDEIVVQDNKATGVRVNGTTITADTIISNATHEVTFRNLLSDRVPLPEPFRRGLETISYGTNCSKINLVLSDLPNFTSLRQHIPPDASVATRYERARGYCHHVLMAGPDMSAMHENYLRAQTGQIPEHPTVQMLIPSLLDDSLTPEGSTDIVVLLFVQYTPYNVDGGWTEQTRQQLIDRTFAVIERYAPGFRALVKHVDCVTPTDIEQMLHLTGGNIFHGSMALDNIYFNRPIAGYNRYATPVANLYSCSAANHPGGGVCGAPGRNAAKAILKRQPRGR